MGLLLPHSLLSSKITFTGLFSKQQAVGQCLPGMESTKDSTLPSCRLYNPGLYLLKSWRFQKQWVSGEIWCSLSICILENIHIFPCCTILSSLSARSNDIWYDPCQVQTRCSPCSPVNLASILSGYNHYPFTIKLPYNTSNSITDREKKTQSMDATPGVIRCVSWCVEELMQLIVMALN